MSEALGIDVSHHQGEIDWKKVADQNKKFAILKCQYESKSHRKDEYFEENYKGCVDNNIAVGVYIYIARASMEDPEKDARSLVKHLNGRKLEYGIWLDLEDASVAVKGKLYIRNLAYQYATIFKEAGYYVGIYCNRDWYLRLIHDDLKKDFDFWIARYPKNDNGSYKPNSSLKPSLQQAVAWQYSSKGTVAGIKTKVDLDVDYDGNLFLNEIGNPYREPVTNIKLNMCGNCVKWIQYQLNEAGYKLKIDGIFGHRTDSAVKDFQEKHNLVDDGIVGILTRTALKEVHNAK
jgi:GH25 family lysozyme M1 (1,4-beta-N-acetylmuramidase)